MTTSVLLVDDHDLQRKINRARLDEEGFVVTTARHGREALELVQHTTFDVIVSDVVMDEIDGFALCRRLRELPALAGVPILLLSAHDLTTADRERARAVGAAELLERTPDFDRELAWIRRAARLAEVHAVADARVSPTRQHESERRMKMVLDNANDTIGVWTLDGTIVEANQRWEAVVGIPACELIGRSICDLAFDPGLVAEEVARVRDRGAHRWTCVLRHATELAPVRLEIDAKVAELDGRMMIFVIGRDITERVAAAERVAALEAMYRSLVEQLPDTVWRVAEDLTPTFVAPNFERLTGIPLDVHLASRDAWHARIHPEDRPHLQRAFERCLREQRAEEVEYRYHHPSGPWQWHHTKLTPREEQGRRFVDGLTSDISARRRLEQSLFASQKMEAIGVLTGGIAHDFNNVLSVILANSELLENELAPGDPRRADVDGIRTAALTRQLLAFSRRQVLELRALDVDAVVAGIGKMLGRMIGEHIQLTIHRRTGLGSVRADVGQLEQVLMNLVVNARDAMPDGGELSISTSQLELTECRDGVPPGSYIVLEVADTGCGMDAATKQRLFEPFFTTKDPGRGTGLGLSTVYGIVRQFEGHVLVASEVGKGTVFRVVLPRTREAVEDTMARPAPVTGGRECVLIVEDDPGVRRAVERILTTHGYQVISTASAGQAIERVREYPIDLVISDIVMPGMSGPEMVTRIRELLPSVRVLLMSGYTDHPQLLGDGGPGFLQKPFSPTVLAQRVREVLDAEGPCAR